MLGHAEPFDAVSWFWSDQYDTTIQIAGMPSHGATTVIREAGDDARVYFALDGDGILVGASGIGQAGQIAKDVRIAQALIARRARRCGHARGSFDQTAFSFKRHARRHDMTQRLVVFQSLWAMERRNTDGHERTLEENVRMIAQAGFDGVSAHYTKRDDVRTLAALLKEHGLQAEGQCFPRTVSDLAPVLENALEFGVHHIDVQPDVRPRTVRECVALLEGWQRLADDAGVHMYIETHRDRMTTDLHFTLDLLDAMPDLKLLADLSHYLVAREFPYPVSDENHAMIHRILDQSWAFHGCVASREQVQVEVSFEPHRMWVDLFLDWWTYGFASWRRRAGPDDTLAFTCELGPKPYAIIGRDGNDTTDRWAEALLMKEWIECIWRETEVSTR
ncbi:hypothetical protein BVER_06088 [Candidatus Burkholderia verschuerenii]|uniref:Reductase C-terminal domain-containing protein n=1 Tax=Candidatus Burkholderia verschuerenii TaxID=242163 RepID=A0A0L0MH12_9BURK|nr:oxidoreductase C-terminal domain-containing protein [Candidatus Burkholderia verschuerenii]KND61603.1 hypothetical protein BVER_06088 [Candidatus Burkholderia verschuerenii]